MGLLGAALGACIVAWMIFPTDMLLGKRAYWDAIGGDNATGLIGFYALAQDAWDWPLLHTASIHPPEGVNIYFTDPVPIAALLGKLFYQATGILFPYMGTWILLCYVLNSVIAYAILRHLKVPTAASAVASLLLILLPAFLWRHQHIGLIAQFTIMLSILGYVRFTSVSSRREIALWTGGTGFLVFLNPYLLAMSSAVILAGLLDAWHRRRISITHAALSLSLLAVTALASAFACGLIGDGSDLPEAGGFGIYSMNLLSPIMPQFSSFSAGRSFLDATGGQYEGFNYLGAGVISLTVLAVVFGGRRISRALIERPFLSVMAVLLVFYAASNVIYVGTTELVTLPYNDLPFIGRITSTFRASGRFFWPIGFLIVIGAVWALSRSRLRPMLTALVTLAVCLQLYDLVPYFSYLKDTTRHPAASFADLPVGEAIAEADEVVFHPGFFCGARDDFNRILELQLIAARLDRPFNGAYINRGDPQCARHDELFQTDPLLRSGSRNPLLVLMKGSLSASSAVTAAGSALECHETAYAYFCSRKLSNPAVAKLGPVLTAPQAPLGVEIDPNETGAPMFARGWDSPSPSATHRWGIGSVATLAASLSHPVCDAFYLSANAVAFTHADYAMDRAVLTLNGGTPQEVVLDTDGAVPLVVRFPLEHCIDSVQLQFDFGNPKSPADLGINSDPRRMTWGLASFRLDSNETFGKISHVLPLDSGRFLLSDGDWAVSGWSVLEPAHRWSEGTESVIRLDLEEPTSGPRCLFVDGFSLGMQTITASTPEAPPSTTDLNGRGVLEIPLGTQSGSVEVTLRYSDPHWPGPGDPRDLAFAVENMRIESCSH
nr:DUF6311 domain-containing protein [Aurantimonas endophytica]